jgi:hypothetical protein
MLDVLEAEANSIRPEATVLPPVFAVVLVIG